MKKKRSQKVKSAWVIYYCAHCGKHQEEGGSCLQCDNVNLQRKVVTNSSKICSLLGYHKPIKVGQKVLQTYQARFFLSDRSIKTIEVYRCAWCNEKTTAPLESGAQGSPQSWGEQP